MKQLIKRILTDKSVRNAKLASLVVVTASGGFLPWQ
jgi:hypothetical protein